MWNLTVTTNSCTPETFWTCLGFVNKLLYPFIPFLMFFFFFFEFKASSEDFSSGQTKPTPLSARQ